jgi:hypothetical protein
MDAGTPSTSVAVASAPRDVAVDSGSSSGNKVSAGCSHGEELAEGRAFGSARRSRAEPLLKGSAEGLLERVGVDARAAKSPVRTFSRPSAQSKRRVRCSTHHARETLTTSSTGVNDRRIDIGYLQSASDVRYRFPRHWNRMSDIRRRAVAHRQRGRVGGRRQRWSQCRPRRRPRGGPGDGPRGGPSRDPVVARAEGRGGPRPGPPVASAMKMLTRNADDPPRGPFAAGRAPGYPISIGLVP